jgi:hypothetical protein
MSDPDRGGLSETPCFYKRTQEKKDPLSLAIHSTATIMRYGLV